MNTIKFFTLVIILTLGSAFAGEYAVIVNKANGADKISKSELKRIYLGSMKNWEGNKVIPINLPATHESGKAFIKAVTKKSYVDYKKYWVDQQIKGAGSAPMEQKTPAAVKLMVSEIPGAIGYIPKSELDDTVKEITIK